jgi:HEAT repeat protein
MPATTFALLLSSSLLAAPAPTELGVSVADCCKDLRSPTAEVRRVAAIKLGWLGPRAEAALPDLIQALRDPELVVAHEVCNTLVRIGPKATPLVAEALRSEKARVRWQAMDILLRLGPDAKAAVPVLAEQVLKGADVRLRILAAQKLGRLGSAAREALPALARATRSRANLGTTWYAAHSSSVCEAALIAVQQIDPSALDDVAKQAVPALHAMLLGEDQAEQEAAARALALLGPRSRQALPALRDALLTNRGQNGLMAAGIASIGAEGQDALLTIVNDPKVELDLKHTMLRVLAFRSGLQSKSIRRMIELLKHEDEALRSIAAMALVSQGPASEPAIPALIDGLADDVLLQLRDGTMLAYSPRYLAAEALSRIGAKAVPALVEALHNDRKCLQAVIALGRLGPRAHAAREPLRKLLKNDNRSLALQAAGALLRLGENPDESLHVLIAGLKDRDQAVRGLALQILYHGGTEPFEDERGSFWRVHDEPRFVPGGTAAEPLLDLLTDADQGGQAAEVLGRMKADGPRLLPRLTRLLQEEDNHVRTSVLSVLQDLGPLAAASVPAIVRQLQDNQGEEVQRAAIRALGGIGPEAHAGVPTLLRVSADTGSRFRFEALYALASIRPTSREALNAMVRLLQSTDKESNSCRHLAATVLGRIGPPARPAIPALQAALLHEDPIVRVEATGALAAITGGTETWLPLLLLAGRDTYDPEERYSVLLFVLGSLQSLGTQGAGATPWLVDQLKEPADQHDDRQRLPEVVRTLAAIGPAAKAALPELRCLAAQEKAVIATLAADAIRKITK